MKRLTVTHLVVLLFALTMLAAGCAKKPVAEETMVEQPAQVEMQQQQPSGVAEQQVQDVAYDAEAEARKAEMAATKGLARIHFDFDQYVLTDDAKRILAANASLLRAAPALNILIEGHCDERGSDEYNLALGQKRALATKNYMVSLGVAAERLSIISYGEEMPLDPARSEDAFAQNRRAEFKVKR